MPSDSRAVAKISLGYCQFCTAVNQKRICCVVDTFSVGIFLGSVYH